MAQPARGGADDPAPGHPQALDPRKLVWADVQRGLAVQAEAVAKSVAELAGQPGSEAALEMARLCLAVLESLGEMGRRWMVDEAVLEAVRQRAFDEGWEACKAQRSRLEVVPGGR